MRTYGKLRGIFFQPEDFALVGVLSYVLAEEQAFIDNARHKRHEMSRSEPRVHDTSPFLPVCPVTGHKIARAGQILAPGYELSLSRVFHGIDFGNILKTGLSMGGLTRRGATTNTCH